LRFPESWPAFSTYGSWAVHPSVLYPQPTLTCEKAGATKNNLASNRPTIENFFIEVHLKLQIA